MIGNEIEFKYSVTGKYSGSIISLRIVIDFGTQILDFPSNSIQTWKGIVRHINLISPRQWSMD